MLQFRQGTENPAILCHSDDRDCCQGDGHQVLLTDIWSMDVANSINTGHYLSNLARVRTEVVRFKESYIKEHFHKYDSPDFPPVWKTSPTTI